MMGEKEGEGMGRRREIRKGNIGKEKNWRGKLKIKIRKKKRKNNGGEGGERVAEEGKEEGEKQEKITEERKQQLYNKIYYIGQ